MADVFVSYSRRDQEFVRRLHAALVAAGREVWVDWEGIPPSAKWMDEVRSAIDAADAFVFVVSPDSAASPVCRDEAEHALAVGKRIVPLVRRDTPEHDLPEAISAHNWLTLREGDDFEAGFATLLAALDTDLEWVKEHTRLVTRARDWEASGRERSRLLRGRDLGRAEQAIARADRDPRPTPLQTSYVLASREAERRGARIRSAVLSGGLVVALVLAGFALLQRSEAQQNASLADQQRQVAEEQRGEAETQRSAAEAQATLAKARELTAAAGRSVSKDPELSILLARNAVDLLRDQNTDRGLREALQASRVRARYEGCPGGDTRSLELSADASRFVTASLNGVVCLWDRSVQTKPLATINVPGTLVRAASISPDGAMVATASEDGSIAVFDATGRRVARWRGHDDQAVDVRFSPDGRYLASAGTDGRASLWATDDWGLVRSVPAVPDDAMLSARFTPDGKRLLTTNEDLAIRAWDVETGAELASYVGPTRTPFLAAASDDGAFVAAVARDETARLWDSGTGTQLQAFTHGGEVYDVSFLPGGSALATASADGLIRIWDLKTGELIEQLAGHDGAVNAVQYTPDGQSLLSAGRDGTVREWAANGAATLARYTGHFGSIIDGDLSPDGKRVLTVGAGDSTVIVHDVATGDEITTIKGHDDHIATAAFSADGTRIVTASHDGTARLWDAADGTEIQRFDVGEGNVNDAAVSPDGSLVVTAGEDGVVRGWRSDGTQAWEHAFESPAGSLAFAPDGSAVYAGDLNGLVVGLRPDGSETFRMAMGDTGVTFLDISPDGTRLAELGFDARVRVLDLATRKLLLDLPPASGYGWQVHFNADGTRLTTGGDDGTVHIYDANSGERLADLRADSRDAFLGRFVDARRIFVTTRANQSMLLDCDLCGTTDEVRALADTRITREMTAEERIALLHERPEGVGASPSPVEAPDPGVASPEPLPPPGTTPGYCTWASGPCPPPDGRFATTRFEPALSLALPPADVVLGESGTIVAVALVTGDQLALGNGAEYTASDGRSLVPIGDTIDDLEAYLRGRPWMDITPTRELTVDGRRARLFQITSDSTQELPYGAVGGSAFFWATGETLDIALVDAPTGPLIVFGDRISDTAQADYDAQFEAAVRSIRFR